MEPRGSRGLGRGPAEPVTRSVSLAERGYRRSRPERSEAPALPLDDGHPSHPIGGRRPTRSPPAPRSHPTRPGRRPTRRPMSTRPPHPTTGRPTWTSTPSPGGAGAKDEPTSLGTFDDPDHLDPMTRSARPADGTTRPAAPREPRPARPRHHHHLDQCRALATWTR